MRDEDKIISIINENVNVDMKYDSIRSKVSFNVKEKRRYFPLKAVALSLSLVFVLAIGIVFMDNFGLKKNMDKNYQQIPESSFEESASKDSIYISAIIYKNYCDKYYIFVNDLDQNYLQSILAKFNLPTSDINKTSWTFALAIGEKNDKEILTYFDGKNFYSYELNISYKIKDIYQYMIDQTHDEDISISLKIQKDSLVFYTIYDGNEIILKK